MSMAGDIIRDGKDKINSIGVRASHLCNDYLTEGKNSARIISYPFSCRNCLMPYRLCVCRPTSLARIHHPEQTTASTTKI